MGKQRFRCSASIRKTSHVFAGIGALLAILLGSLLHVTYDWTACYFSPL